MIFTPESFSNFNAGSCTPQLKEIVAQAEKHRHQLACNPVESIWHQNLIYAQQSRVTLAGYLSCDVNDLLLIENASQGVNLVLQSFDFKPGDELLTSDLEYHHFAAIFRWLQEARGIEVKKIKIPLEHEKENMTSLDLTNLITAQVTPKTKMLFISHVLFCSGTRLPIESICEKLADSVTIFIDGAQGPGLVPVDLSKINAHYYVGNLHKWVMSSVGSAFLHVRDDLKASLKPLIHMGPSQFLPEDSNLPCFDFEGPSKWQYAFEYWGTQDKTPHSMISYALDFRNRYGEENIFAAYKQNRARCSNLCQENNLAVASHSHPKLTTCMLSLPTKISASNIVKVWADIKSSYKISLGFPCVDQRVFLRISNSWFLTDQDYQRLETFLSDPDAKKQYLFSD